MAAKRAPKTHGAERIRELIDELTEVIDEKLLLIQDELAELDTVSAEDEE